MADFYLSINYSKRRVKITWITVDSDLCTRCGTCETICSRGCFTMSNEVVNITAEENCNLCGHCVAICPTGAVFHNQMNMEDFVGLDGANDISTEKFIQFIRKRRSHRHFQDRDVPWGVLMKLVDICRYAPTGSNAQTVEVLVITDRQKIHRLSELTIGHLRQTMLRVEKEMADFEASGIEIPLELASARARIPITRQHISAYEAGRDPVLRNSPAVLIFHSAPHLSTPKDDCVIAAHTVTLTAMTMGLETCYIGLLEKAAEGSPAVMDALNLPHGNKVYSVLIVGYPRYRFLRTVDRKPINYMRV